MPILYRSEWPNLKIILKGDFLLIYSQLFFFYNMPSPCNVSFLHYFLNYLSLKQEFFFDYMKANHLGVKVFTKNNIVYLDLGYSHWCLLKLPSYLHIFCKKKNVYFCSNSSHYRFIIHSIRRLKTISVYKAKGLLYYSKIKYLKLKVGKKQQM